MREFFSLFYYFNASFWEVETHCLDWICSLLCICGSSRIYVGPRFKLPFQRNHDHTPRTAQWKHFGKHILHTKTHGALCFFSRSSGIWNMGLFWQGVCPALGVVLLPCTSSRQHRLIDMGACRGCLMDLFSFVEMLQDHNACSRPSLAGYFERLQDLQGSGAQKTVSLKQSFSASCVVFWSMLTFNCVLLDIGSLFWKKQNCFCICYNKISNLPWEPGDRVPSLGGR